MSQSPTEKDSHQLKGEFRPLGVPIDEDRSGCRVDLYLSENFKFFSRAIWQRRMRQGWLQVSRRKVRPSYRLRPGDQLELFYPRTIEPEVDRQIFPIWKKGAVMAVYKPGNLPMHENGPYRNNTFAKILQEEIGKEWAAVHRLDKETSGIVLCGATQKVRQELAVSLANRVLDKEYLAISRGTPPADFWVETGPIGDLGPSPIRIKKWVVEGGLSAETEFEVVERKSNCVLLKARPKTGRTNQIRIHAAYAGLPLVGDKLYHPDEQVFLDWFEHGMNQSIVERTGFRRCLLHAHSLTFIHPETDTIEHVRCAMPEDMSLYWEQPDSKLWLQWESASEGEPPAFNRRSHWENTFSNIEFFEDMNSH